MSARFAGCELLITPFDFDRWFLAWYASALPTIYECSGKFRMALFLGLHVGYYVNWGFSFKGPRLYVCYLCLASGYNCSVNSFRLYVLLSASPEDLSDMIAV